MMQKKARSVISLAKPFNQGAAKSHNLFAAQILEHIQSGFSHRLQYFGSSDSIFPNYINYKNKIALGNGGDGLHPVEISVHGHTVQKLASYVMDQLRKKTMEAQPHPEFEQIHQLLGIEQRGQDEEIEGSLRIKIRGEMERLFSINEQVINRLITQAKGQALPKLLNGLPINYQKTFHLVEYSMEMPSAMGIPISYHYRMPVHFSLRGNLKIVNENGLKDVQLQAELHPVYAWKTHEKLSFKAPFTGKKYQAGVQRHLVVEAPFRALVRKAPRGQVVVAITPTQLTNGSPTGKIDLVTYHQRPYTIIVTDEFWPTSHKEGGTMSIVHAVETPYKNEQEFGQKELGLNFIVQEESEYRTQTEGQAGWAKFWKRFHTPGCYFNLGYLGAEEFRPIERTVSLDVSKSDTKTIAFVVGAKLHLNPAHADLWQDSDSDSSQSSEERASSEFKQNSNQDDSQEQSNEDQQHKSRGDSRRPLQKDNNSQEDPSQQGRVVAIAMLGKRVGIRSPQEARGQIQKILQKENPSTFQYLVQVSHSRGRFYVRAAAGDAANEAAAALPQTSQSLQAVREAVVQPQNTKTQQDGCVEFEGEYDAPKHANRHQLLTLRKVLLQEELSVKVKAEAQFGESCKSMPHEIKLQGKLFRGPKMTEWAQKKSPEAQKCEKDEKKGFSVSPVCMYVAEHQAAALNHVDVKVMFSQNLPAQFQNGTYHVEDFVKAYLYPYLSTDRFHEGTGERAIRIQAHMTPQRDFIDVIITKPNSRISFRSIHPNRLAKTLFPLTATQSLAENVRDRVLRADSEASCSIEGNQINTFDNVTYRFNKDVTSDCYHVLAKDCSGRDPVAVLVKDVTVENKEITLLLGGQNKIKLVQRKGQNNGLLGKAKLQVEHNDQRVESLPRVIRTQDNGRFVAKIELVNEGAIQIISRQFNVITNGKYIVVYAANSLRNRTCGLCSSFDGEKIGEFQGPKGCPLSSGSLLVASYAYQSVDPKDNSQCKIQPQAKQQIAHEEANCQTNPAYNTRQRMFEDKIEYSQQSTAQQNNKNVPASDFCVHRIKPAIRTAVFDTVYNFLKPLLPSKSKVIAEKIANIVAQQTQEILTENTSAQDISEAVVEETCEAYKQLFPNFPPFLFCRLIKHPLRKAVLLVLNPVCKTSRCCTQLPTDINAQQIQQELAFIFIDQSEADQSDYPFIPASELPMPCLQRLEKTVSSAIGNEAMYTLSGTDLTFTQQKDLATQLIRIAREDIRRTMAKNGRGNFIEAFLKDIPQEFPQGEAKQDFIEITKRVFKSLLVHVKKHGCSFPEPTQNSRQHNQ
jgi:hypothetical protein